jgi:hypothetical protein
MKWQPIEDAPFDGTEVVLWYDSGYLYYRAKLQEGEWWLYSHRAHGWSRSPRAENPTWFFVIEPPPTFSVIETAPSRLKF